MSETSIGGSAGALPETLWTEVLSARGTDPERARAALSRLIERYWKPVYFFVRRRGAAVERAKDQTQAFFLDLLERSALDRVDPARGRFRAWLLTCLRNFLADQADRDGAAKRGGGAVLFSLEGAETEYLRDLPSEGPGPEEVFHRKWAMDLLREAVEALDAKWRALILAQNRGESVDARRAFEARAALRQALLARLRGTVASARDADEELRDLLRDFGG
jgi:RNA polymerase sigma-70 factor (ECF subfamily)